MTTVLLVDDHQMVRDGIKWMFINEPSIEVIGEASTGAELFDLLSEVKPDVILLDIRMPGMSGLEIMAKLNESEDAPRVLMLSMYDEPGLVQQAVVLGASGYLKKSAGREELLRAIDVVASGRPYLQGELAPSLLERFDDARRVAPNLSDLDRGILQGMALGHTNHEIAVDLGVDHRKVVRAVRALLERLDVHSRSEAVALALRLGAID